MILVVVKPPRGIDRFEARLAESIRSCGGTALGDDVYLIPGSRKALVGARRILDIITRHGGVAMLGTETR